MIAFVMVVYCISGWGGKMLSLPSVKTYRAEGMLQYNKKWERPDNINFRSLGTLLYRALIPA